MQAWMLLFLLPLITAWASKWIAPREITWAEMGASIAAGIFIVALVVGAGLMSATYDTQIYNGQITGKTRVHDSYIESYSCNCSTDRKGNRHCSTCFRTHYTVDWDAQSTLGKFDIDHEDSTSKRVYGYPDPARWLKIMAGDPVSRSSSYTNYVKGVPESLFHLNVIDPKFQTMLPEYPDVIYDLYNINRVISVGVSVPDITKWNTELSLSLRTLGPSKQANVVIVLVNTADENYYNSLRTKWLGGRKNDVIVVIGTSAYPKIDWVQVIG